MNHSLKLPYRIRPIYNSMEDFSVLRKIGEGAFSVVFECMEKNSNRLLAVKKVDLSNLSKSEESGWETEIHIHKNLNHKHIVKLIDFFVEKDSLCMVMENCSRGTLLRHMSRRQLDVSQIMKFFRQACLAVGYLHMNGILMRDIKPENMLIDDQWNIKLCDFGWSCHEHDADQCKLKAGTFEYMAPETLKKEHQSFPSDIWGLGVLLYEMLTTKEPFVAMTPTGMLNLMARNCANLNGIKSEEAKSLLKRIFQYEPEKRPTIQEVLTDKFFFPLFQWGYADNGPRYDPVLEELKEKRKQAELEAQKKAEEEQARLLYQRAHANANGGANGRSPHAAVQEAFREAAGAEPRGHHASSNSFNGLRVISDSRNGGTLANNKLASSLLNIRDMTKKETPPAERNEFSLRQPDKSPASPLLQTLASSSKGMMSQAFLKPLVPDAFELNRSAGNDFVRTDGSMSLRHIGNYNTSFRNTSGLDSKRFTGSLIENKVVPAVDKLKIFRMEEEPVPILPLRKAESLEPTPLRKLDLGLTVSKPPSDLTPPIVAPAPVETQTKIYNIYTKNMVQPSSLTTRGNLNLYSDLRTNTEPGKLETAPLVNKAGSFLEGMVKAKSVEDTLLNRKPNSASPNPARKLFRIDESTNRYVGSLHVE